MEFRILGSVEVAGDREPVPLGGRQRRLLLALLISRDGDGYPLDALADALWAGDPPDSSSVVLHAQISRLRRILEPDRKPRAPSSVLRSDAAGYRIDLGHHQLDARRFEELLDEGRTRLAAADPVAAKASLEAAIGLWRGPAYGDLASHSALSAAASGLDEKRLTAVEELTVARLQLGEHADLVPELEALVATHPFRERIWSQLMLALYRCGRQADALAAYQRCRRQLGDELGIDPGPDLQTLEEAILLQKDDLAWRPAEERGTPELTTVHHDQVTLLHAAFDGEDDAETIRRAVQDLGGEPVEVGGVEEPTLVRFDSPAAAVQAVVPLMGAASSTVALRCAAVHTGTAVRLGDEWFGPAVSYVNRLGSLAYSGQVLVSGEAAELIDDGLPAEASLRDLGLHRFLDRTQIQRVHQLSWPGATTDDFPPLRTGAELIGVPIEISSFVGRSAELSQVTDLIRRTRLLTLTGPGGTGKTRLALRAARQALDVCSDGVVFVDLAPIGDPYRIAGVIARLLRLPDDRGEVVLDSITSFLRDRTMLLVLDNCDHLVTPVAELSATMLGACEGVRVLATSREPLAVQGETIWPVPALSLPDGDALDVVGGSEAVRLFCERARSSVPGFELTDENARDVSTICRRLDGLPLAVELAAARLRVLSPSQIADRLDDRFSLLTASSQAALPRHQTLRAVVDWSYEQLHADARRLLAQLAVFPASFGLAAAEAVGGPRCLELLTELIDKSLVQVSGGHETRYRMLETLRAYATERLREDPATEAAAGAAHARFYAALARQAGVELRGPDDLEWSRRIDADYENVRAAMRWASAHDHELLVDLVGSLGDYWFGHGPYRDADTFTKAALAADPDTPGRALALCAATWMALVKTDFDKMHDLAEEALALATHRGERRARGDALFQLAYSADAQQDFDEALVHAETLTRFDDAEPWHYAEAFSHLVRLRLERDELDAARQMLPAALAAAQSAGDRLSSILVSREAGRVAALDDDEDAEFSYHQEALRLAAEAGHGRQVVWCLRYLRRAMLGRGDLAAARRHATNAAAMADSLGGSQQVAATQLYLAELDRLTSDTAGARSRLDAVQRSPAYHNPALLLRGEIEWLDGRPGLAHATYESATTVGHDAGRACGEVGRAVTALASGETVDPAAIESARVRLLPPARPDVRAWYLAIAARALLAADGDARTVRQVLDEALAQAAKATDLPSVVRVVEQIAYLVGDPDRPEMVETLHAATAIRERIGMPRARLEEQWHTAACAAVAGPALVGRPGQAYGRDDLIGLAGGLLAAEPVG